MENDIISSSDEEEALPAKNVYTKIITVDAYTCTACPYPIEIFKIDDKNNTITFKCLNPKENQIEKTIQISEYLYSMRKNTYLYSECSLCNRKQNEFKETPVFSYCIKCETIICPDCFEKHLKTNEKNHPSLSIEYIIKNNEKSIKCLSHPKEKNLAFCLKCNTHLCKECLKSEKHINHNKVNIIEILITDEIKNILNDIINIYNRRITQLTAKKPKKESKLFNEKEYNKEKKRKQKLDKIKEVQKDLKKELLENEKLLKDNLYKLKLKYEKEVELCKSNFNISKQNIKKRYKKLNNFLNKKFNEEIDDLEKEYKNNILTYDKKIDINNNLLSINYLLKNAQENYPDNYYHNNNIYNIIFKYYESKDENIKQLLSKDLYNELCNKVKEEQIYNSIKKGKEKLNDIKNLNNVNNVNNNIINDKDNKIIMTYKINKEKKIKILGEKFVKNNKKNYKLLINKKEYKICEYIEHDKYEVNKKENLLTITLVGIKNTTASNLSHMFYGCKSLTKLNLHSFNTQNVTNMEYMFYKCSSLTKLNLSTFNTEKVTNMAYMFGGDYKGGCSSLRSINLSSFNTENVTYMQYMFYWCSGLKKIKFGSFNTQNVVRMDYMFSNCSSLTTIDLSSFKTEKVTTMESMFDGCHSLKSLDLSLFKTEKVTSMNSMFSDCSSLTSLDLIYFNTQNVTRMDYMLSNCSSLTILDLSSFNTQNVTKMDYMLSNCSSLTTLDLSSFKTEKVTSMNSMFSGCSSLTSLDLRSFNTQKVTTLEWMFRRCSSLTTLNLSSFNLQKNVEIGGIFDGCGKLSRK